MDTKYYIACDIGGTQIRVAVFTENNIEPTAQKRIPTRGPGTAVERLIGLIRELWPQDGSVAAIGAAAPGSLDPETGILYIAPNIPGWINLPLRRQIEEAFPTTPIAIGNDANMALLGEWRYGAGKGHSNLLFFTVSTGIGGAAIIDNHLLLGQHGLGTELGHVQVMEGGPMCGCGQRGHLESISSGTAVARYVAEKLKEGAPSCLSIDAKPTSRDVAIAAFSGDALAIQAFEHAGHYLGIALADFLHIFNPSIVIFGGGVSLTGDLIFAPMRAALETHLMSPQYLNDLKIVTVQLGDDAGLVGAYVLAQQRAATAAKV